nr:unnamed protein product [Callosobruchus analis]
MKNVVIPHKLTTKYGKEEYTVVNREGNEITIRSVDGHTVKRLISHLKKLPNMLVDTTEAPRTPDESHNLDSQLPLSPTQSPGRTSTEADEHEKEPSTETRRMKPRKLKKKEGMWRPVPGGSAGEGGNVEEPN